MAKVLFVETTPNPLAMKLKLDQQVTTGGSRFYSKKDEAWDNPLAQRMFDIHGVDSLFFMEDFITVAKTPGGIWDFIFFQTNEVLMSFKEIQPLRVGKDGGGGPELSLGEFEKLSTDEQLAFIDRILNESIRPGLARDGGGLQVMGLKGNVLSIRYQGACGSCPSSTAQTLHYIENMLQNKVSSTLQVVPY